MLTHFIKIERLLEKILQFFNVEIMNGADIIVLEQYLQLLTVEGMYLWRSTLEYDKEIRKNYAREPSFFKVSTVLLSSKKVIKNVSVMDYV